MPLLAFNQIDALEAVSKIVVQAKKLARQRLVTRPRPIGPISVGLVLGYWVLARRGRELPGQGQGKAKAWSRQGEDNLII